MTLTATPAHRTGRVTGQVRQLIGGLDRHLSQSQGVRAFSDDPQCILRMALVRAPAQVTLSDGATIQRGQTIVDIHCWNDRVPAMPGAGPDLAWAQAIAKRLRYSLKLLVAEMPRDPALAAARACRAGVNFVGQGGSNISVSRIIARMGFEDVDEGSRGHLARVHDGFENLLIAALVWTHNPGALRRDKMFRQRRPVYASREKLLRMYAGVSQPRGSGIDAADVTDLRGCDRRAGASGMA